MDYTQLATASPTLLLVVSEVLSLTGYTQYNGIVEAIIKGLWTNRSRSNNSADTQLLAVSRVLIHAKSTKVLTPEWQETIRLIGAQEPILGYILLSLFDDV